MYICCADLHKLWCITACGEKQFNVISRKRKSAFPRTRIYTLLSELPQVEIHKSMCNPRRRKNTFPHVEIHMRSCISACGNTPKIMDFPACGNTHFLVYFHMRKFEQESEFPRVNLQVDSWILAGKNVQEYTIFQRFPHAEIHAEMWIPACGNTRGKVYYRMRNTLNQVQKNSL